VNWALWFVSWGIPMERFASWFVTWGLPCVRAASWRVAGGLPFVRGPLGLLRGAFHGELGLLVWQRKKSSLLVGPRVFVLGEFRV
jgi:hypothetical protein